MNDRTLTCLCVPMYHRFATRQLLEMMMTDRKSEAWDYVGYYLIRPPILKRSRCAIIIRQLTIFYQLEPTS
jgi:hypothetical protein